MSVLAVTVLSSPNPKRTYQRYLTHLISPKSAILVLKLNMASPYDTPRIPDFDHNSFNLQVRSWIEYWLLRWDSRLSPTEAKVLSEKFEGDGDVAFKFERAQWVALYGPVKGNLIDSKIRELQSPYVDVRYFTSSIQALLIVKRAIQYSHSSASSTNWLAWFWQQSFLPNLKNPAPLTSSPTKPYTLFVRRIGSKENVISHGSTSALMSPNTKSGSPSFSMGCENSVADNSQNRRGFVQELDQ